MNVRVSKKHTRRSRVKLSKALLATLLDSVTGTQGTEFPRSDKAQSQVNGALTQSATPSWATKRPRDGTFESDLLPAKRARLTQKDPRGAEDQEKKSEQADKPERTTVQQPAPKRRPYASFLRDFVDPVDPDPPPESIHTFVSEWLGSVGSDREKRCRSDSNLDHSNGSSILRLLTRSAPEMGYARDVDGYMVPLTPISRGSHSSLADQDIRSLASSDPTGVTSSGRSSARSLVEDPLYRDANLAENHIYMRSSHEEYPNHIASIVDEVGRDRNSPGPSADDLYHDPSLEELEMGAGEPEVEQYFRTNIFPYPKPTEFLKRSDKQPISKHAVPSTGSKLRVSNPVPDMVYGYNRHKAFTDGQQTLFNSMGNAMVANAQNLLFPFFVIEFKGDSCSSSGSLWVATNQCLGGSASCVKIAERLNHQLTQCRSREIRPINSAAFSVAMSGTEARLYVSWKHDELKSYMRKVDSFLLQNPDHYLKFRKYVLNIIDWGKESRLKEIRDSLDALLEESRKRVSTAAKARRSPLDNSMTSIDKKSKSSSARRNSSKSNSDASSQYIDEEPALSGQLELDEEQQNQSQVPLSFESAAEAQRAFATSCPSSFTSSFEVGAHDTQSGE